MDEHMRVPVAAALAAACADDRTPAYDAATPAVSIVVPCHDHAPSLADAVESALGQTVRNVEVMVVADGGSGDTLAVCATLLARHRDRALRVIHQACSGQPAIARNVGIAASRGAHIVCLDADDQLAPTFVARCLAALAEDPGASIAYTDRRDVDDVEHVVLAGEWDAGRLPFANQLSYCALVQRAVYEAVGGYRTNVKGVEDWDFWVAAAARGFRGRRVPEPLFWYRRPDTGLHEEALGAFATKRAQIVCNNREAYPPAVVAESERRLAGTLLDGAPSRRPLVSVVLTTKDRPTFLRRALSSVLAQTWRPLEVLLVNDGGAPVDALIAELDADGVVTAIRIGTSRERSAARNTALRLARGEYVACLDDDDWWDPGHLACLVERLERDGSSIAFTRARRVREVRCGDVYVPTEISEPWMLPYDVRTLLVGNILPILTVMVRRACLEAVGGFDEALATHEDWELFLRLARRWPFVEVPEVTANVSYRDDGSTTTSGRAGDFLRTTALVYRRWAAEAAAFPDVAAVHARFLTEYARLQAGTPFACSIVVPARDDAEALCRTLTAVAEATADVHFEVVLVDDGATPAVQGMMRGLGGDVHVVPTTVPGSRAAAWNTGARAATAPFVVFLDAGLVPRAGWLGALLDEAETVPDVVAVGARVLARDGTLCDAGLAVPRTGVVPYPIHRGLPGDAPAALRPRAAQALSDACLLVRRDAFVFAGGFDEAFTGGLADADLCLRLRARGGRCRYQPRSVIDAGDVRARRVCPADVGLFEARWEGRVVADEDLIHARGGCVRRVSTAGGDPGGPTPFANAAEQARWAIVAEAEERALDGGAAAARPLLVDVEAWPADVGVLDWAARLCAQAGVAERAEAFRARAEGLRRTAAEALARAAAAVAGGRLDEAAAQLDVVLGAMPGHHDALCLRGTIALSRRDGAAAQAAFAAARAAGVDWRRVARGLGAAARVAGDPGAAVDAYAPLVAACPDDVEAVDGLLEAAIASERWNHVLLLLGPVAACHPQRLDLRFALAQAALQTGHYAEARCHYAVLAARLPERPEVTALGRELAAAEGEAAA